MANADRPNGFVPHGHIKRLTPYLAKGTIAQGDAVKRSAGSADTVGKSEIVVAAATDAWIGVSAHQAVTGNTCLVYDHPDQEFQGQADDASIATDAKIGLNYDLLATAGVDGKSRMEIDASTFAATATLPLKVLRIVPALDNAMGEFVKCVVKINNHQLNGGTGTAGV